jgi:hypothetical protein
MSPKRSPSLWGIQNRSEEQFMQVYKETPPEVGSMKRTGICNDALLLSGRYWYHAREASLCSGNTYRQEECTPTPQTNPKRMA